MSLQDPNNKCNTLRTRILLSFQKIMLGEVTPELRGVSVGWTESTITGLFYYDCLISDDIEERVDELETLIIADFPNHSVGFEPIQHSGNLPDGLLDWIYLRAE